MRNSPEDLSATVSGWVSAPNDRGTADIVWSSLLAIFLCTWTAVCLNIPHPDDTKRDTFCRKAKWMFWAVVGPELVLSVAIGQYASARRSVKRFRSLGLHWTLRHGFFADMGGIVLQPRDSASFVVNSRQLAYLVEKGYLRQPLPPHLLSEEDIWDKSKADTLARTLTLLQASWLVIQLVGRAALRLPTTTLELSAGAIVFCTLGTFVCWLHKPSDVNRGVVLSLSTASTAQILREAGVGDSDDVALYRHTPLEFVAKESFTCGYDVMGFFGLRCDRAERPLRRFPNDRFPDIGTAEKFFLFCVTSAYAALHLVGWHFFFPTRAEQLLWRVASSAVTAATVFFWVFETIAARHRFGRWDKYLIWLRLKAKSTPRDRNGNPDPKGEPKPEDDPESGPQKTVSRMDAFEEEQKKSKPILMWEVGLILPIVFLYAAARGYMLVEMFVSLREVPALAYKSISVLDVLLPHW